eukprot:PhM_4_TR15985/c0_g1_i1/m.41620
MDPSVELETYRKFTFRLIQSRNSSSDGTNDDDNEETVLSQNVVSFIVAGIQHAWSPIRDEVVKNCVCRLNQGTRTALVRFLWDSTGIREGSCSWQALVGSLQAFHKLWDSVQGCGSDMARDVFDFVNAAPVLGHSVLNVRNAAVSLIDSVVCQNHHCDVIPGKHTYVSSVLDLLPAQGTAAVPDLLDSYLALLSSLLSSPGSDDPLLVSRFRSMLLGLMPHPASTIRQRVSEALSATTSNRADASAVLAMLSKADAVVGPTTSPLVEETLLLSIDAIVNRVLVDFTDMREFRGHVDPYYLAESRTVVPDVLMHRVARGIRSEVFEVRRVAELLLPLVVQCALLWSPVDVCVAVSSSQNVDLRREVLKSYIFMSAPTSSHYLPRLIHVRPAVLRLCYTPNDAYVVLLSVAYLDQMFPAGFRFSDIAAQKQNTTEVIQLLPDVGKSVAIRASPTWRADFVVFCTVYLTHQHRNTAPPLYQAMSLLEAIAQALCLVPDCPDFVAHCAKDALFSPPRTWDGTWNIVPNTTAASYGHTHRIIPCHAMPYQACMNDVASSPSKYHYCGSSGDDDNEEVEEETKRTLSIAQQLRALLPLLSRKGVELPVFKMLLLMASYAVKHDPASSSLWIDAVARRLEVEPRSDERTKPKTGNSFDDSTTDEDEEGACDSADDSSPSSSSSFMVYDFSTLERLYTAFVDYVWELKREG